MGRLPMGSRTSHVQGSTGPQYSVMNFYCTQNSTTYGQEGFKPRTGKHVGTGYQSNFRPGVYYSRHLDELDNPEMGRIVARNYNTVTKLHFLPSKGSDGRDPLPRNIHMKGSGFVRQTPITTPTVAEVRKVHVDTHHTAPFSILPKAKPLLHKIQSKDPVELENGSFGPGFMTTETHVRFDGKPMEKTDFYHNSIGNKEESGFTHAYNVEPVTFHPGSPHKGEMPGWMTDRPTGVSIMKTNFLRSEDPSGKEPLPNVADRAVRDTGFTHETAKPQFLGHPANAFTRVDQVPSLVAERTRKNDPAEYVNMAAPNNHSSLTKNWFKGAQRETPSETDRLGRTAVGWQELSGYSANNDRYVHQPETLEDLQRFVTHYKIRFHDKNPEGIDREGHTWGGLQEQLPDGFTKSTAVHSYGPAIHTTDTLRRLHPYVARSIKGTDPFYDDHTHDSKMHSELRSSLPPIMA
ncbi:PREDICTED: protein phosphatase 1 regulatory subunit 32-like [Branchiostoma belcheri]|uniref:Protein phosphatase 1 regulatory subunit 32-like n=1 Tax=Branchiostoma belcheri TaxID=7741 RepID=A0A6P4ZQ87_BRABE|nr:PREDICTED: protein phosphatase 1 regulatory subunit 32-like [Branchiostoma belcheri]KAI8487067.1 hypothetical protein Bbelb_351370 [Branchiostoma belcheri]